MIYYLKKTLAGSQTQAKVSIEFNMLHWYWLISRYATLFHDCSYHIGFMQRSSFGSIEFNGADVQVREAVYDIINRCKTKIGHWVGSSVVHLGDHNVPNALMFIDKYTQVCHWLRKLHPWAEEFQWLCFWQIHQLWAFFYVRFLHHAQWLVSLSVLVWDLTNEALICTGPENFESSRLGTWWNSQVESIPQNEGLHWKSVWWASILGWDLAITQSVNSCLRAHVKSDI